MKKRVYNAAKFIAEDNRVILEQVLDQIGVSPQCGFASHREGNPKPCLSTPEYLPSCGLATVG